MALQQFAITWIEECANGFKSKESIKVGAVNKEEAIQQIHRIANVIEILSVTKII